MAKLTYNEDDSLLIVTEIIKDMEWARSEESNISETGSTSVPANCETCEV